MTLQGRLILALIIVFTGNVWAQSSERKLSGQIISNGEPVDFAYILNCRSQKGAESNNGGLFQLMTQVGDTLRFSCLGYIDTTFVISQISHSHTILEVHKQSYALQEIEVRWFYSYAAFKYAFLNLKLDDKDKPMKFNINLGDLTVAQRMAPGQSGFGINLGSLATLGTLLDFSNKPTLTVIQKQDKVNERYNRLISHENIAEFTKLKGAALDSFIIYLRTKANIAPHLSDYDMMVRVKTAFNDFLALNTSLKDSTGFE